MPTDAHRARRTSASLAKTLKHLHARSGDTAHKFAADLGFNGKHPRQSMLKIFKTANGITYHRLERFEKRLGIPTGIILCLSHSAALIRVAKFDKDEARRKRASARLELMVDYLGNLQRTIQASEHRAPLRHAYEALPAHDEAAWFKMLDELMDGTRGHGDPHAETEFTGREFRSQPAPPSGNEITPVPTEPVPRKRTRRK